MREVLIGIAGYYNDRVEQNISDIKAIEAYQNEITIIFERLY